MLARRRTRRLAGPNAAARRTCARHRLRLRRFDDRDRAPRRRAGPRRRALIFRSHAERARARTFRLAAGRDALRGRSQASFPAESFDLMFSRFGVMFFGDPTPPSRICARRLKPSGGWSSYAGGRFRTIRGWRVPFNAATKHVPRSRAPGPPEDPARFRLPTRGRVTRIPTQAGFAAPTFTPFDFTADIANGAGSMRRWIGGDHWRRPARLKDQPDDLRARALRGSARRTREDRDGRSRSLGAAVWIVETRRA